MKSNSDDYQEVLLLWESIWTCSSMKKYYKNLELRMFRPEFVMFTPFPGNVLCVFLCVHFSIWQIKKKNQSFQLE